MVLLKLWAIALVDEINAPQNISLGERGAFPDYLEKTVNVCTLVKLGNSANLSGGNAQ